MALWPDCDVLQRRGILHCDEYWWVRDQINSGDTLEGAVCQALSLKGCQGEAKTLFIEVPEGLFGFLVLSFFASHKPNIHTPFQNGVKEEDFL